MVAEGVIGYVLGSGIVLENRAIQVPRHVTSRHVTSRHVTSQLQLQLQLQLTGRGWIPCFSDTSDFLKKLVVNSNEIEQE